MKDTRKQATDILPITVHRKQLLALGDRHVPQIEMFVGQRAAVRVPPRPRAAHLEEVQFRAVRDRPPVVVEDRPEREVAPEVIYDARKVPREAVRAEQGVVDGPRRRR